MNSDRQSDPAQATNVLFLTVVTLSVSLLITAAVWWFARFSEEENAHVYFQSASEDVRSAIAQRMRAYEMVLRGGVGLFNASTKVTRQDWNHYVASLNIEEYFPGIQGVGYAERIAPTDLSRHIQSIRAEGFPDYEVKPPGQRDEYTAIKFLEPFDARNRRAFGFDMFSEPTRHRAMAQARDTGKVAVSGKVKLKQETSKDVQSGFLMYVPRYAVGMPLDTIEQRRAALRGYVYSPFRIKNLMRGILGRDQSQLELAIYDGTVVAPETLMYRSNESVSATNTDSTPLFVSTHSVDVQGHTWTLVLSTTPDFAARVDSTKHRIVAAAGLTISILFAAFVWALSSRRTRAVVLARTMTATLREREAFIRAVVDNAADGIITFDESGVIHSFNRAAQQIFGYSVEQARELSVHDLLVDAQGMLHGLAGDAATAFDAEGCEVTGLRSGGLPIPLELSVSEIMHEQGRIFAAIVRDITKRKEVDRLKDEFVSTVSHELRTPLTSIRASLALVVSENMVALPGQIKELLNIAHRNSERLLNLINDLLDVEKIQSGAIEFVMAKHEMLPLVEQVVEANQSYAQQFGVQYRITERLPGLRVTVDAGRLTQILANLLSNAAKFSHPGAEVEIAMRQGDGVLTIAVTDYGKGIAEDFQDKIFGKFCQADGSDTRQKGGTGLGLNIARSLAEGMHCQLSFESKQDQGTTFNLTLPLAATR